MATYQVRVKVEIVPCTEAPMEKPTKQQDGSFQITLTDTDAISIDRGEQALVQTAYPTFREALSTHLSAMSKKKPMSI